MFERNIVTPTEYSKHEIFGDIDDLIGLLVKQRYIDYYLLNLFLVTWGLLKRLIQKVIQLSFILLVLAQRRKLNLSN